MQSGSTSPTPPMGLPTFDPQLYVHQAVGEIHKATHNLKHYGWDAPSILAEVRRAFGEMA